MTIKDLDDRELLAQIDALYEGGAHKRSSGIHKSYRMIARRPGTGSRRSWALYLGRGDKGRKSMRGEQHTVDHMIDMANRVGEVAGPMSEAEGIDYLERLITNATVVVGVCPGEDPDSVGLYLIKGAAFVRRGGMSSDDEYSITAIPCASEADAVILGETYGDRKTVN
jgi:hypothetical protein